MARAWSGSQYQFLFSLPSVAAPPGALTAGPAERAARRVEAAAARVRDRRVALAAEGVEAAPVGRVASATTAGSLVVGWTVAGPTAAGPAGPSCVPPCPPRAPARRRPTSGARTRC